MGHFDEPKKEKQKVSGGWMVATYFLIILVGLLIVVLIKKEAIQTDTEDALYELCRVNNDIVDLNNDEMGLIETCYNKTLTRIQPMNCALLGWRNT